MTGRYADKGLVVLGINVWDEPKAVIARYAKVEKLRQRILLGGSEVADQYHVISIPTTLWINRQGVVVATELDSNGPSSLERKCKRLLSVDES